MTTALLVHCRPTRDIHMFLLYNDRNLMKGTNACEGLLPYTMNVSRWDIPTVCESERHRAILSMIRAGAVEEAFRFCGGKAVSGASDSISGHEATLRERN